MSPPAKGPPWRRARKAAGVKAALRESLVAAAVTQIAAGLLLSAWIFGNSALHAMRAANRLLGEGGWFALGAAVLSAIEDLALGLLSAAAMAFIYFFFVFPISVLYLLPAAAAAAFAGHCLLASIGLRSWPAYVVCGAALGPVALWLVVRLNGGKPAIEPAYLWDIRMLFAASGMIAAFVFWRRLRPDRPDVLHR